MPTPNRVLFAAYTPAAGTELWVSDGTAAGTSLLKDIAAGKGSSSPGLFTQFGGLVVFEATDATHGTELWVTDGTTAGTSLLKDINPGSASGLLLTGNPALLTRERPAGGQMVFAANDGVSGQELWVTNGTTAGTSLLQDIYSGSSPSNPEFFATFGTGQLFEATDGLHRSGPPDGLHGQELWVTDGTAAGTALVADLVPDVYGSGSPRNMVSLGTSGRAVFSAAVGSAGRELWVTDGSAAGTSMLADIRPGAYKSSNPGPATPVGSTGKAVFAAVGTSNHAAKNGGTQGTELWVTDGTPGNTSLLKTFSEGYSQGSDAFLASTANGSLTTLGNKVLFTGADAGASALWATDGTAGGTVKISSDGVAVSLSAGGSGFTPFGGKELFWNGTGLGASPWVTDGTAAGTVQLKQLSAQAHQGESYGFAVAGGRALFNAVSAGVHTLWVTDGTPRGTYDIGLSGVTNPKNFTTLGNKVIFQATDGMHGTELWISDGFFSGTTLLKDINTNNTFSFAPFGASSPVNLTAVSLACFAAGTRIATPAGKTAVEDLREGDQVVTASGKARPVLWIGRRHIRIAGHPNPEVVASVRIAPHAFGRDKPHTAVYLSQDHAVFANQVLIPIRYLVNGTTVTMTTPCDVTYYHVELPTHDVVLAEGLPVESYLDSGDRGNFANSDLPLRLFPDLSGGVLPAMVWEACGCAPLKIVGPEVEAVRARLQRRSRTLQRREAGAAQSSTRTIPS